MAALTTVAEFRLQGVNGDTINLTDLDSPIRMGPSPTLFGDTSPTVEFTGSGSREAGDVPTATPRHAADVKLLDFVIVADSQQHLFELTERLAVATDPTRGTVLIVATRPGSRKERSLRLLRTQSINPDFGAYDGRTITFQTIFRAPNPYWSDLVPLVSLTSFPITGSGLTYTPWNADIPWDSDIPWNGWQATGVQGEVTTELNSNGTAPTWPRFEVTGPFTGLEMINSSSGKRPLLFNGTVSTGQTLVIETREGSRSVRVGGVSRMGEMNLAESDWWPLVRGDNSITVAAGGAIDTNTSLRMSFTPQHLTC